MFTDSLHEVLILGAVMLITDKFMMMELQGSCLMCCTVCLKLKMRGLICGWWYVKEMAIHRIAL